MIRVLIAGKSSTARMAIAASLIRRNCQITCVANGDAARGILNAGGIDICVIDPDLPGTSGVELCAWIYSAHLKPPPYVILLARRSKSAANAPMYRPGADEYFTKPVDPDRLSARISALAQGLSQRLKPN